MSRPHDVAAEQDAAGVARRGEAGFTLLEAMFAVAVLLPLLAGIAITSSTVTSTVDATTRSADVVSYCRAMSRRLAQFVRPAQLASLQAPAVPDDVANLRAAVVGEWVEPTDLVWRPGLEFTIATGFGAWESPASRRVTFTMEVGESDNGIDDDGDGLIDEGQVTLSQDTVVIGVLRDVEDCRFSLDGRVLQLRMRVARRDTHGRVYRSVFEQQFYLRNN